MEIDYLKAWFLLKRVFTKVEKTGNILQQSMAKSHLDIMHKIEKKCVKK